MSNLWPWAPGQHIRGRCAVYSCRDSDEVGEHLLRLIHRANLLPTDDPRYAALVHDVALLQERAGALCALEDWEAHDGPVFPPSAWTEEAK